MGHSSSSSSIYIYIFIHSFVDSDTKIDNYELPSLSILCISFQLLKSITKPVHSHIFFIRILIREPTFILPPPCPLVSKCDKPLEPLNTCPLIFHFLRYH